MSIPSPDTKAVYDAVRETYEHSSASWSDYEWQIVKECCAEAIRATTNRFISDDPGEGPDCCLTLIQDIRSEFINIATELNKHP